MTFFDPPQGSGGGGGAADLSDINEDPQLRSDHIIEWTDSASAGGTADTALARQAAGELWVTDGGTTPESLLAGMLSSGSSATARRVRIDGEHASGRIILAQNTLVAWDNVTSWAAGTTSLTPDVAIGRGGTSVLRIMGDLSGAAGGLLVGDMTPAFSATGGDFAAGVSASGYRLEWDASAGDLLLRNSSGTLTGTLATTGTVAGDTVLPGVCQARLSTSSTDPLAESGTAATIYLTPHTGNQLSVYVTSAWEYVTLSSAPSITLSTLTADTVYDIFCDETPTLNAVAWTNDTTRATALTRQDGALIETSSSHLYVGTIKLNASKQIVYDTTGRAIWNEHNRVRVATQALDTTDSWTRDSATWRQANGSTSNQVEILLGRAVDAIDARVGCLVNHSTAATQNLAIGIGIDSTTTNSAQLWGTPSASATVQYPQATASYAGTPAEGARSIKWLERGSATATNTFFGDNAGNIGGGLVVTSWH